MPNTPEPRRPRLAFVRKLFEEAGYNLTKEELRREERRLLEFAQIASDIAERRKNEKNVEKQCE